MKTRKWTGAVLARCVREHPWDIPPPGLSELVRGRDLIALPEAATRHGVIGCVHHSLSGIGGVDSDVLDALREGTGVGMARHLNALGDLAALKPTMDDVVGSWLVVKGPVLNETLYERPDLRSYGDLDLLVQPSHFAAAANALIATGARLLDRNWSLLDQTKRGQLHFLLPFGTIADLHWDLINVERDRLSLPTEGLFDRSRSVTVNGIGVRTLSPEDTLLHLAVHACLSGGDRLIWLKDIERSVAAAIDWDEVVLRARSWRIQRPVSLMLSRAVRSLGAAVPPEVTTSLSRSSVRRVNTVVDHISPVERASGGLSISRIAARAAARGPRWTVAAAGRHAIARVRRDRSPRGTPLEILDPQGGEEERLRFFEAVGRQAQNTPRR
jgi:hypothetical protein